MKSFIHTVQKNQLLMMTPGSMGRTSVMSFIKHSTPGRVDPKVRACVWPSQCASACVCAVSMCVCVCLSVTVCVCAVYICSKRVLVKAYCDGATNWGAFVSTVVCWFSGKCAFVGFYVCTPALSTD